jgi:hypothetical protein
MPDLTIPACAAEADHSNSKATREEDRIMTEPWLSSYLSCPAIVSATSNPSVTRPSRTNFGTDLVGRTCVR